MSHEDISDIPPDKKVTYARIIVDDRPQKSDPNHVRQMLGVNILNVPGDLITTTSDLTKSKIRWNSVLSTKYARFSCIDIKNMLFITEVLVFLRFKNLEIMEPL